ncbi:MAG: rubredoxin [Desulfamplus sp.]|nr:rubredoxin [Desulfamplus sp.]
MKKWKCLICKYVHEGDTPPDRCPICKAPASKFVLVEPSPGEDKAARIKELEQKIAEYKTAAEANKSLPAKLYHSFQDIIVKHHAHPISVHFPNGVLPVAFVLFILSIMFGDGILGKAGFFNLFFVMLTLPFVLFAGYVEWIKKYNRASTSLFQIKIVAALVTTALCLFNVIWFIIDPDVLSSSFNWLFIFTSAVMLGCAGVAGHLGGKLVFKD